MTNASNAILVDTNIRIYAHDPRDRWKQDQATVIVDRLISRGQAVLSVQCLLEFFNVSTLKLPEPLSPTVALAQVERLVRACSILDLTPQAILEGCRAATDHSLSIWDALIWATAKLNQIPYVLTEDMQHGLFLEGVRFQDPFSPEFDPAVLEPTG